jgi:thiol:disulfide interchange protein DsbD
VKLSTKIKVSAQAEVAGNLKKEGDFAGFDEGVFARLSAGPAATATSPASGAATEPADASNAPGPAKRIATGPDELVKFAFFGLDFKVDPTGAVGIWAMILLAVVGGLLLNFTPCVLPVIPIKMMSLSRAAGDRGRCLWLGLVMSLGVVLFWLGLGIAISATAALLTSKGESGGITSANQLFQKPAFTIAVGVVVSIMAVGMCGLFTVRLPQFVYNFTPKHDSIPGSLGMGVMTAVLSTPCTAPFMGAAAAWAVGVGPTLTLTVFAAIGVGMALPYMLLSAFPEAVGRMPRTGPASELIKQVMGLLMLAAGAYFVGTGLSGALVDPPEPPTREYWWGVAAFVVAAGLWLGWRTLRITPRWGPRTVWCTIGLVLALGAVNVARSATAAGPTMWVYYTPELFKKAQEKGKIVVMDFTAEWCLNCKVLEKNVLETKRVSALFESGKVVPMKVDLTGNNTEGNDMLHSVDSVTIPLLVVFDKDGRIVFKSDAYMADQVIDAVKKAGG